MGRYLSDENTILTPQFINLPAGVAVSAGNLLTIRSDGKVYPAPQAGVPASWFNNTSQKTISALTQTSYFDSGLFTSNYQWPSPYSGATNSTGISGTEYTAFLVSGNGGSAGTGLTVRTMLRNNIIATTFLNTTYTNQNTLSGIYDLGNGSFLVLYWNSSTSRWVYQILNAATHAVIVAETAVSANANTASSSGTIGVALLSNGNVVLTYLSSGGAGSFWRIISNTGGAIVAETSLSQTGLGTIMVSAGGGFFVLAFSVGSTLRFRRFTNAGALVGAEINTGVNQSVLGPPYSLFGRHWVRSDGFLVWLNTQNSPDAFTVYDTTNTIVANNVLNGYNGAIMGVAMVDNIVYVIYNQSNLNGILVKFGTNNQVVYNTTLFTAGTTFSIFANADRVENGSSLFTVGPDGSIYGLVNIYSTTSVQYANYYLVFDQNGAFVSSTQTIATPQATQFLPGVVIFNQDTVTVGQGGASGLTYPSAGYYFPVLQSIYGVAASNASAGQSVKVQVVGTATVTPSIAGGGSFNSLAATIPGNRGIFGGTGAVLYGV